MRIADALARVFPPPRFMTLPAAGIDVSDASLKYVQFRQRGRDLTLERFGDLPVPKDAVQRGDIVDRQEFTDVLKRLRTEAGVEYARVSLPEERAYLFETKIPSRTPAKNIRSAIEFHLEENVPLKPQDALFDYAVVAEGSGAKEARLSVAVYARDTIESYFACCRDAGLVPIAFEVEAQAIARAVTPSNSTGTYMIVDFGQLRTGVGIVHRGALMFTSTVEIGGEQLTAALKEKLPQTDERTYTRLKNEVGLLRAEDGADVPGALLPPVAALKDELATRISYWNLRDEDDREYDRAIEKVLLCGGSANLAGLAGYLSEALDIETVLADVWQNALSFTDAVPPISRRHSYGYATAVGLALGGFTGS